MILSTITSRIFANEDSQKMFCDADKPQNITGTTSEINSLNMYTRFNLSDEFSSKRLLWQINNHFTYRKNKNKINSPPDYVADIRGSTVTQQVELLPQCQRLVSILTLGAICVEFVHSPVVSGCSNFLPHPTDVWVCRSIGLYKFPIVCRMRKWNNVEPVWTGDYSSAWTQWAKRHISMLYRWTKLKHSAFHKNPTKDWQFLQC